MEKQEIDTFDKIGKFCMLAGAGFGIGAAFSFVNLIKSANSLEVGRTGLQPAFYVNSSGNHADTVLIRRLEHSLLHDREAKFAK